VDESFHVRVPTNHDRSRPAGVLVWISPTDDGRLPPVLERGVDELGLIAVGAEMAGNTRPLTDRLQLMLDAVETARRRFLIDEERVYVAGMSGGGRCAAMLQCALPEVFAGTVPIVGIDTYHHVPTGHGDARWAARFGKPPPPVFHLLKSRRIAPITGDLDFNDTETRARAGLLAEDGLTVRVEIVPGMGHTLPPPDTFARVLSWVDQPRRDALAAAEAEAARLLAAVPSGPPTDHATHAALEAVAAAAPWSAPAWEAAERLGYSRAAFLTGER
jgi:dienelactone hydrolase